MTTAVMVTLTPPIAPLEMAMATLRELLDANGAPRTDAPASAGTAHSMAVGDVFLGNLADPDDNDWVRIELAPGTTYVMRLTGHGEDPLNDPLLELYDAGGERVAWNDDLHQGVLHSQVVFTTPAADADAQDATLTYYLNARSYWRNPALRSDGDYALSLEEQPSSPASASPGPDALAAAGDLLQGGPGVDVFVFHDGDGHDTVMDFDPAEDRIELHLYYDRRFEWQALDIEADRADTIIRINQNHSLRLREVAPDELGEEHFVFVGKPAHSMAVGDVFLGNLADPDDNDWVRIELAPGTTYVMRLTGHGEDPLTDPLLELYDAGGERVAWNDDLHQGVLHSQVVFTTPAADADADAEDAPLTYYLNARSYRLNPALRSDGDYALSLDEQAPLQAPAVPPAAPEALLDPPDGTLTGTSGPDSLRGDAADNVLEGGPGPDVLDGGGQPPDGYGDSASYRRAYDGVTVSLETRFGATFTGDAEGDVLIDIENLIGSNYDDVLSGDVGDNILLGGPGDDILAGGGGADLLVGGPGVDTVTYARNLSNHGVRVDLAAGVADGASAEGDRLAGVENLIGSSSDDQLYGSAESNRLWGGRHGDDLMAGRGGRDVFVFHENDGHDTVADFDPAEDRIELHLYYGQPFDWQALDIEADGADTVIRVNKFHSLRLLGVAPEELGGEHFIFIGKVRPRQPREDSGSQTDSSPPSPYDFELFGGPDNDTLTGTDGRDFLSGGPGNDVLNGGPGNSDVLDGGPGADVLDGGAGFWDTADYRKSPAGVTVNLGGTQDADGFITASGGDAQGDKLKNIESIWGSAHADTLTGDAGWNTLNGGPGADILDGGIDYDFVDYRKSPAGVTVNLGGTQDANGFITASGGDAQGDKLKNIEHILGSAYNDTLTGDDKINGFTGNGGDDTLTGGGQVDHFVFTPGGGNDVITDFTQGEDVINLEAFNLSDGINDLSITTGTSDTVISVSDITITLEGFTGTLVDGFSGDFAF